jgi:hypothetical protein
MGTQLPSARLATGVHDDNCPTRRERSKNIVSCGCESFRWYPAEVLGGMFDDFNVSIGVPVIKPFLEGRPAATLRWRIGPAAEGVKGVLAGAVGLAPKKRQYDDVSATRQLLNPTMDYLVGNQRMRVLGSAWPCTSEERDAPR